MYFNTCRATSNNIVKDGTQFLPAKTRKITGETFNHVTENCLHQYTYIKVGKIVCNKQVADVISDFNLKVVPVLANIAKFESTGSDKDIFIALRFSLYSMKFIQYVFSFFLYILRFLF